MAAKLIWKPEPKPSKWAPLTRLLDDPRFWGVLAFCVGAAMWAYWGVKRSDYAMRRLVASVEKVKEAQEALKAYEQPPPTPRPWVPRLTVTRVRSNPVDEGESREVSGSVRNDSQESVDEILVRVVFVEDGQELEMLVPVEPKTIPSGGVGYFRAVVHGRKASRFRASVDRGPFLAEPDQDEAEQNQYGAEPTAVPTP